MKSSASKDDIDQRNFINQQQVDSESDYRGLPENQRLGFAKQPCYLTNCPQKKKKGFCEGHVRVTTAERAYELGVPLWRRVNPVSRPRARCSIYDVISILNIVYEFEFRSNPLIALKIAFVFRAALIRKGYAPSDLPIFISGGGVHLIINIPQIHVEKETAKRWNRAIEKFTEEQITPIFEDAKKIVQASFQNEDLSNIRLEGHDIARLLSSSGDWRPSTHDEDADYLKNGMMRYVYEDQPLIRNEWKPLKTEIENAYHEIENNELEKISTMYQQKGTPDDDYLVSEVSKEEERKWRWWLHAHRGESTANAVRRKILYKIKIKTLEGKIKHRIIKNKTGEIIEKRIDRSKLVNQIVFILCDFCRKYDLDHRAFIRTFETVINECSGNKYKLGEHLHKAMKYYVIRWEEKEQRGHREFEIKSDLKEKRSAKKINDASIRFFFQHCVELDNTAQEDKSVIFEKYTSMCEEQGFTPIGNQQFTRVLSKMGISTKTRGKNRVRCYIGIRMKTITADIPSIISYECITAEEDNKGNPEVHPVCKNNPVNTQHSAQHYEHILHSQDVQVKVMNKNSIQDFIHDLFNDDQKCT